MFSEAYLTASQYTRPVIVTKRLEGGEVQSGCATFMALNDDGWVITAAHVMQDLMAYQKHSQERSQYVQEVEKIQSHPGLTTQQKKKQCARLVKNRDWITNVSYWWGRDGITWETVHVDVHADIAAVKLKGVRAGEYKGFPRFASPKTEHLTPGRSLCRIGFPFHEIKATFDEQTGQFSITNLPPLPMFPNEGIHTRILVMVDEKGKQVKFVETSSPGLRGQSGGPILDARGAVWAVQSQTMHLSLGFAPKVKQGNKEIIEHQFMHIGVGCHVEHVLEFLTLHGITHQADK